MSKEDAAAATNGKPVKASKKDKKEKKNKKRPADEANGAAASVTEPLKVEMEGGDGSGAKKPKSKKRKVEETEQKEVSAKKSEKESKEAKKARKEAKKAAKAAANAASASATTSAGSTSLVDSSTTTTAATSTSATPTPVAPAPSDAVAEFLTSNAITIDVPDGSSVKPILSFAALSVPKELMSALSSFTNPTPIQACCWPVLLEGKDVVGIAETGSGKTLAFGLPALQHISKLPSSSPKKGKKDKAAPQPISVLVVAPTRELAIQTHENLEKFGASLGIASVCLYGGVSKQEQQQALASSTRPVRIVVGTPGRVLDLANEGSCDLSQVSYLVLDEADRMLDKGFENDIRTIIGKCMSIDEGRHTCMFSATWPFAVRKLAETFMRQPVRVTVGSDELNANKRVEQTVEVLDNSRDKEARLSKFLRSIGAGGNGKGGQDKVLIFALYKKEAMRLENNLRRQGYRVAAIHGDLNQQQRIKALEDFKVAKTPLLVATDVAARGLDIPNVEWVVNNTFPLTVEDYIHRIGRTGRGGKTGKSITFFTDEDKAHAGALMRVLKDAGQPVPEAMSRFSGAIKKKEHGSYGAFYREDLQGLKAKKITFD